MRRKYIIVSLFLITVGFAAWMCLRQEPLYKASSTVITGAMGPDILTTKDIMKLNGAYPSAYKVYMGTQREIIKSRRVAYHVIKNLGLRNKGEFKTAKDPIMALLKKLKADTVKGTGVIKITAADNDPEEAGRIANEFARVYVNSNLSLAPADCRIQDFADVPSEPLRQGRNLSVMLAVILGITGAVSAVFYRRRSNDSAIKDPNEIVDSLQLPVLGSVPEIKLDGKNVKTKIDINRIVEKDPLCIASEAYRSIRSKLLFSLNNSGSIVKSIVITSSASKEGKTISAVNLAIMMANSGENTLLVDAHARKPRIHKIFNMSNDAGFTNYLSGEADFSSIVKYPGIDNLYVVTSGKASYKPVKSVFSKNIKLFLEKTGTGFSRVIFDGPPAAFFAEAVDLLNICDGTVLIVEGNNAGKNLLNKTKELSGRKGANVIGVILNKVPF